MNGCVCVHVCWLFQIKNSLVDLERDVKKLVGSLHGQGFSEQLAWLADYIADEAKDRQEDGGCVLSHAHSAPLCVCVCVHVCTSATPNVDFP